MQVLNLCVRLSFSVNALVKRYSGDNMAISHAVLKLGFQPE